MKRRGVAAIERRLASLGFDGAEVNTRCLLQGEIRNREAYRDILLTELTRVPAAGPDRAPTLALRGKVLCILESYPEAENALRASLELDRRQPRVWVWLGEALLLQAQAPRAKKAFDAALRLDSRFPWAYFFRAVARSVDAPVAAQGDLRRLLTIAQKGDAHAAALVLLCLTEAGKRRFPSARLALKLLSRTKLSRPRLGALARAVHGLEFDIGTFPGHVATARPSALEPAILRLRAGKTGEAIRLARAAAPKLGGRGAPFDEHQERLRLELLALDFDKARSTAEWILRRTRKYEHLHHLQRPFFGKEFDFVKVPNRYIALATEALNRYIEDHPKSPWGYYWRDVFRSTLGTSDRNPGDIEKIARVPKRYAWMRSHSGFRYLFQEDFQRAIVELKAAAAASDPGDWMALCFSAEAFACLGDVSGAMNAFKTASAVAPSDQAGGILAWKGEVLLWCGEYALALKATRAAVEMGAGFAYCWLGGSLVKLGRFEEALPPLIRAIELTPYDAEARGWLAEAYLRLGRFKDAAREIDAAIGDFGRYCSFHLLAVEGLVRNMLGDPSGMRKALNQIPPGIRAYIKSRTALETGTDDGMKRTLEALLDLSRGVRRGSYENRIWMRPEPRPACDPRRAKC